MKKFVRNIRSANEDRIIDLRAAYGPEGYGVYVMLLELISERPNYGVRGNYRRIAFLLHATEEVVRAVVEDFGLFSFEDEAFVVIPPETRKRKSTPAKAETDCEVEPVEPAENEVSEETGGPVLVTPVRPRVNIGKFRKVRKSPARQGRRQRLRRVR